MPGRVTGRHWADEIGEYPRKLCDAASLEESQAIGGLDTGDMPERVEAPQLAAVV